MRSRRWPDTSAGYVADTLKPFCFPQDSIEYGINVNDAQLGSVPFHSFRFDVVQHLAQGRFAERMEHKKYGRVATLVVQCVCTVKFNVAAGKPASQMALCRCFAEVRYHLDASLWQSMQ